ncbi:MAG TPA: ATP-binding protein, partial [Candidatus Deferrimicrobium sp.]|nr:ATP-binding protein [Candidatus Deferrimicrobium sp.]
MRTRQLRDPVAIALAAIALLAGLAATLFGSYQTGVHWSVEAGRLVVADVDSGSQAERDGVTPGMIAVIYDGQQLILLPAIQYGEPGPSDPPDATPPITGIVPAVPTNAGLSPSELLALTEIPLEGMTLISPSGLATGAPDEWPLQSYLYPGAASYSGAWLALVVGLIVLVGGAWWLRTGRSDRGLQTLAIPLAVAVAAPLLVQPLAAVGSFAPVAAAGLVVTAAMIPFAAGLAGLVPDRASRDLVAATVILCGVAAAAAVLATAIPATQGRVPGTVRWLLLGAIPLLPGLAAAGPIDLGRLRGVAAGGAGRLLQSSELAVAGATPIFAVGTDRWPFAWPLVVWLLAVFIAARFTVRPLARLATRATLQRDLIVAATEAERARLAADIHDDALQELTLLVRRLEASGDTEGAEIGRTVADRLRAICGDLRLPILDDLGVGPALDWLVLRIERLAGGEVRLERADDARHSPDVELAIFRVAQEALANAVKHGKPPIVVRYRSTPGGISLAIDDSGPGIADDAPADAERAGRFGLLNMAQRAEQIGAILDVKRWPTGGTHVALEWR